MAGSRSGWSRDMALRTITPMALTFEDRDVRPLTADEVLRMVDAGILGEDEPVELLHGVLTAVSPKSPAHEAIKMRLIAWLAAVVADGDVAVRIEAPMAVPDQTSLPEPDLAVVAPGDYLDGHPASALLVVEVAVSSLPVDTRIKAPLFAAADVPEYWVVDVAGRCVRTFTSPQDGAYTTGAIVRPGERLTPRAVDALPLDVAALLAGT